MIDALIRAMEREKPDMATLCSVIDDPAGLPEPHVVKCVLDEERLCPLLLKGAPPSSCKSDSPIPLYKHIGIYGFTRPFLETFVALPKGRLEEAESLEQLRALEAGHRIKVIVTQYEGIGMDTEADRKAAAAKLAGR